MGSGLCGHPGDVGDSVSVGLGTCWGQWGGGVRGAGDILGTAGVEVSGVGSMGTGFCGVRAAGTPWGHQGQGICGVRTISGWGWPGSGQWGQVFMKPGLWGHQGQGVCGAGDILGTSGTAMTRVWAAGTRLWGGRAVGALGTGCPQVRGCPGDIRGGWARGWDHPEDFRNRVAVGSRLQDHPEGAGTTLGQMSLVLGWLGPALAPSLRFQVELPRSLLALMHVVSPPPNPREAAAASAAAVPGPAGLQRPRPPPLLPRAGLGGVTAASR